MIRVFATSIVTYLYFALNEAAIVKTTFTEYSNVKEGLNDLEDISHNELSSSIPGPQIIKRISMESSNPVFQDSSNIKGTLVNEKLDAYGLSTARSSFRTSAVSFLDVEPPSVQEDAMCSFITKNPYIGAYIRMSCNASAPVGSKLSKDPCQMSYFTCNSNGQITRIELIGISGNLPSSVGNFSALEVLRLPGSSISGAIPREIGNLKKLWYLDLSNNQLTGEIPYSFRNLSALERLYLNKNQLVGSIPTWIGNLKNMQFLDLSTNQMTGIIPESVTQLTQLYTLILNDNALLGGQIPTNIGDIENLLELDLRNNNFSGPIPTSIVKCRQMYNLLLTNNRFNGSIPNVVIYYVNLDDNQLTGTLPDKYCCQGAGLIGRIFSAQRNRLSGSIPVCSCSDSTLLKLLLTSNNLVGSISNMQQHTNIQTLLLSDNSLAGSLAGLTGLTKLQTLDLSNNYLSSTIPKSFGLLKGLVTMDLRHNQLSGAIPSALCNLTLLSSFYTANNLFDCYPTCLSLLRQDFTTTMQHCQSEQDAVLCELAASFPLSTKMRYLIISSEQVLHGSSLDPFPYQYFLKHQVFVENAVSYSLSFDPISFDYLKNYRMYFYNYEWEQLFYVQFYSTDTPADLPGVGSTPPLLITELGFYVELRQIVFDNTVTEYFITVTTQSTGKGWTCSGGYASSFCSWTGVSCAKGTFVTSLSLHGYGLQGVIPRSIGLLTSLVSLDLSFNKLKGSLPSSMGRLVSATSIDVSSNMLNGTIDESILALPHLVYFSASNNGFSGPLPIFTADSLINLNLDTNNFQGIISAELCHSMVKYSRGLVTMVGNPMLTCYETCWIPFAALDIFSPNVKYCAPSSQPSGMPTMPTSQPSNMPSSSPSQPSSQPSCQPSRIPSLQPTGRPTRQPFVKPTNQPKSKPSKQPFENPTNQPSVQPSSSPSNPSSQPSSSPTRQLPPILTQSPVQVAVLPESPTSSSSSVTPLVGSLIGVGILVFCIILLCIAAPLVMAYNRRSYYQGLPVHLVIALGNKIPEVKDEHLYTAYILDNDGKTAIDLLLERHKKMIGSSGPNYEFLYRLVSGDLPVDVQQPAGNVTAAAVIESVKSSSSHFHLWRSRQKVYTNIMDDALDSYPARTNIDRCMQGYSWTTIIQREEDFAVEVVRRVLAENKEKSDILSYSCDKFGRRHLDIASGKCKLVLNSFRYLHGRYELKQGPPEHKSKTSLIKFAIDRISSEEEVVALKFMSHRSQYLNEILSRARGSFSNEFVISVLRSYDGESENEEDVLFRQDAIFKGYSEYPYCVVMDVADQNLKKVIDQQNICAKEWDDIRSIIKQIAIAFEHIHSKGFIHGDIKPTNIVLTGQKLRLIDFDASASINSDQYAGSNFSSAYIPPELLFRSVKERGKVVVRTFEKAAEESTPSYNYISQLEYSLLSVAPSFDMWSFGAVIYLLCTGETLFKASVEDNASQSELQQLVDWSDKTKKEKLSIVPNKHARNLISLLLCKDPAARLSPKYVLSHPFLTGKNPSRMQGEQAKYDVFLSYRVDSDSDHVMMFYDALSAQGLSVWLDKECLLPGQPWEEGFCDGLINSATFVCLLSRGAINHPEKPWQCFTRLTEKSKCDNVLLEWNMALELRQRDMIDGIFPIFIGDRSRDGSSYGDYFSGGCHPRSIPDLTVTAVAEKLQEHLDNQGLGAVYTEQATVKSVVEFIAAHQGGFLRSGDARGSIPAIVAQITEMIKHSQAQKMMKSDN